MQAQASGLNPGAPPFTSNPTAANLCSGQHNTVLLQTAQARVCDPCQPSKSIEARILLDGGSQRSYITERVQKQLSLQTERFQRLSIATFGASRGETQTSSVVKVGLELKDGSLLELSLLVMPIICEPLTGQPIASSVDMYPHLATLNLADDSTGDSTMEIDILIGSDYYWELVTGETCRGSNGPIAIHTRLGWVLSGPTSSGMATQSSVNLITTHILRADTREDDTTSLDKELRSFWEIESLGISEQEKTLYDDFSSTVTFREGRYEVPLPWKDTHNLLPDNLQLCKRRLHGLLRRLKQTPETLQQYHDIIQDQIKKGIVESVLDSESTSGPVHYLPHHAVIHNDKTTTKLRIVYDASARSSGPSLNNCLYTGPKFNQHILDILLRFRTRRIALVADIEKAFLMISVVMKDRDALRFLWVKDIVQEPPEVCIMRFARVVFGVSSSPFLLNATVRYHLEHFRESHPELVQNLLRSTYVDDIITGADSEDEALNLYVDAKSVFRQGGFNLRKFSTNSPQLQQSIAAAESPGPSSPEQETEPEVHQSYAEATLGNPQSVKPGQTKVLGVCWDPDADRLVLDLTAIAKLASTVKPTKRNVVSTVGKIYDPLGLVTPVVVKFKIFFQTLCEKRVAWDDPLPADLAQQWESLIAGLQGGPPISIPRVCFSGSYRQIKTCHLYGFCDASARAYAAVIYMVIETEEGYGEPCFVAAKSRVAPIQPPQTIPRLELLSALLLSRLITTVIESLKPVLPLSNPKCFTDSQVALFWIRGLEKEWKQFIQNRVSEIRNLVAAENWNHCAGTTNPADLPSRGLTIQELSVSRLWHVGPEWLPSTASKAENSEVVAMPEECKKELKAKNLSTHSMLSSGCTHGIGELIDASAYSSMQHLRRVTAYIFRAVRVFKSSREHTPTPINQMPLTASELADVEKAWVKQAQRALTDDSHFVLWKKQLRLYLDNGLWRCGGRLENASLPYSTKHPLLLPRNHPITPLLVQEAHLRVKHNGVKETLTELREKFWIIKGRSLVRLIIHRCVQCRRFEGPAYKAPPPPPLPACRVKEEAPFSYTGVDFAGPFYVRIPGSTADTKVWLCLYTCCVTRAVHLDIVPDLSTETFIRCFKRFTARRGLPRKIISDNGKTFTAAAKMIQSMLKHEDVQAYTSGVNVEWSFNIEKAPWWGGFFERMVKSAKRCLRKMIGQAKFTADELRTAVIEVEAIINSRPLLYISPDDLEEPLTPSHLLMGRRVLSLPDNLSIIDDLEDETFELNPGQITKRMKHLNNILNHFWKRWRSEYLLELRDAHRQTKGKRLSDCPVSVGDIVLVHDESLPRGFWKIAMIEELITGQDGMVRGAVVRQTTRARQPTTLRRPLQLLYPLEIHAKKNSERDVSVDSTSSDVRKEPDALLETTEDALPELPNDPQPNPTEILQLRRSSRTATARAADGIRACAIALED